MGIERNPDLTQSGVLLGKGARLQVFVDFSGTGLLAAREALEVVRRRELD